MRLVSSATILIMSANQVLGGLLSNGGENDCVDFDTGIDINSYGANDPVTELPLPDLESFDISSMIDNMVYNGECTKDDIALWESYMNSSGNTSVEEVPLTTGHHGDRDFLVDSSRDVMSEYVSDFVETELVQIIAGDDWVETEVELGTVEVEPITAAQALLDHNYTFSAEPTQEQMSVESEQMAMVAKLTSKSGTAKRASSEEQPKAAKKAKVVKKKVLKMKLTIKEEPVERFSQPLQALADTERAAITNELMRQQQPESSSQAANSRRKSKAKSAIIVSRLSELEEEYGRQYRLTPLEEFYAMKKLTYKVYFKKVCYTRVTSNGGSRDDCEVYYQSMMEDRRHNRSPKYQSEEQRVQNKAVQDKKASEKKRRSSKAVNLLVDTKIQTLQELLYPTGNQLTEEEEDDEAAAFLDDHFDNNLSSSDE